MEDDEPSNEIKQLEQRRDTMIKVCAYLNTFGSMMVAIAIVFLIWKFIKKGSFKYMPIKLSLAIFGMLVINVFFSFITIICDPAYSFNYCNKEFYEVMAALDWASGLFPRWLFASHYLKVACLFRIAFS